MCRRELGAPRIRRQPTSDALERIVGRPLRDGAFEHGGGDDGLAVDEERSGFLFDQGLTPTSVGQWTNQSMPGRETDSASPIYATARRKKARSALTNLRMRREGEPQREATARPAARFLPLVR